jgi:catechol 2,3-dioxygenase-like lactoylglutathione lyase family enzyme
MRAMIVGVKQLVYGVADLDAAMRFYDDFGLAREHGGARGADYRLPDGSAVIVRALGDPRLPERSMLDPAASGAKEVVWGVDTQAALDALVGGLRGDRPVTRDAQGTYHSHDDSGIPFGLALFERIGPICEPPRENVPGRPVRVDTLRKWFSRAEPLQMQHVGFMVPDVARAARFYVERLGFRITDLLRGRGAFLRAAGRGEHHQLFLVKTAEPQPKWHHVSFTVENIDALMTGANIMQRRGWTSDVGIGRHRASSTLFYYITNPGGGQSEYSVDTDMLTDAWQPRVWHPLYANFHWVGTLPPMLSEPPPDEMYVWDEARESLESLFA